jgi:capsular polysaccharide biosynthesis protein
VIAAHAALRDELERVLSAHREADPAARLALSRRVDSVRAALDEARRVLVVDRWREAHRHALGA